MTEERLQTPYGVFSGVTAIDYSASGMISGIRLSDRNAIVTHAGQLIPFYGDDTMRRKYKASVTFHNNGMIRAVSLEEQQEVLTPIGELPAELVTFYDTGELKRVFPLDGKISGFWSEDDERALNIPLNFDFDFTSFSALISGIYFYKTGAIKSVTLYPGETISIKNGDLGEIPVRVGFSLYENGALESLEPAVPINIRTPIGMLTAYDTTACGINADSNSLSFDESGRVTGLVMSFGRLFVRERVGSIHTFMPMELDNEEDDCANGVIPLSISFDYTAESVGLTASDGVVSTFRFDDDFIFYPGSGSCTPSKCASCSLCSKK